MSVVRRIYYILQDSLECVLIWKYSLVNVSLQLVELFKKVYGRLLIACRRVLEVCRRGLELERVVVVL